MADGRHVRKCWKCYNSPTASEVTTEGGIEMRLLLLLLCTDMDETWVVTSHHVPDMFAIMRLPWQRPLPSNGARNEHSAVMGVWKPNT